MTTMIKPELRLDEEHRYWLMGDDGTDRQVPGYSEILADLGFPKSPYWTEQGRAEGSALHWWLKFLAQGKKSKNEPEAAIAGRVEGIRKFLADTKFEFVGGEEPQYEPISGYATTPDAWGRIGAINVVVEMKRGAKICIHALQTSSQKLALAANGFYVQKRYGLYLKEGDYRLDEHLDRADESRWRAIVAAYHAKRAYLPKEAL